MVEFGEIEADGADGMGFGHGAQCGVSALLSVVGCRLSGVRCKLSGGGYQGPVAKSPLMIGRQPDNRQLSTLPK